MKLISGPVKSQGENPQELSDNSAPKKGGAAVSGSPASKGAQQRAHDGDWEEEGLSSNPRSLGAN